MMNMKDLKPIIVKGNEKQRRLTVTKEYKDYIKLNDKVIILKYEDYKNLDTSNLDNLKNKITELEEKNKQLNNTIKHYEELLKEQSEEIQDLKSNNKSDIDYLKILYRLLGNLELLDTEKEKLTDNNKLLAKNIIKDIITDYNKQLNNLSFLSRLKGDFNLNINPDEYNKLIDKEFNETNKNYFNINYKNILEEVKPKIQIIDTEIDTKL